MLVVNLFGAPGGSRTHYPCLRRAVLYPNELRVRNWAILPLKRKNAIYSLMVSVEKRSCVKINNDPMDGDINAST